MSPPLRGLLPLAVLLGFWELAGSARSPYFPPPSAWAQALADRWAHDELLGPAGATVTTFGLALATAVVLGIALGLLAGGVRAIDRALSPTLEFARAMPPAAIIPIATLLIGYNGQMKVAVVASAAIWPILLNTRAAIQRIDPVLVEGARALHLSARRRVLKVTLPAIAPGILLGVRIGAPIALVVTLLVEFLTQVGGIGGLIATAQRSYMSAEVWGLILVAGLFSLLVNALVGALEGRTWISRRGARARRRGSGTSTPPRACASP
jgi:ABC-type nitrate/sulfonate/bicarbonate transport system permease component